MSGIEPVMNGSVTLYKPLDFQAGPDGALYVNNYAGYRTVTSNTSIIRIEYTGDCRPLEPKLEQPSDLAEAKDGSWRPGPGLEIQQTGGLSVTVQTAGEFSLQIADLLGRPLAARSGHGVTHLLLEEVRRPGIYFLNLIAPEGRVTRKIVKQSF